MIIGAIIGPTGIGKSQMAIDLALKHALEVISFDSRQVYKDLIVGTGQPTQEEMQGVKHHLFNFCPIDTQYNVDNFMEDVGEILKHGEDKKFVMVGGTGLYLKTLMEGISNIPPIDEIIRQDLRGRQVKEGNVLLFEELKTLDSETHSRLNVNDSQRILRALEVCLSTGQTFSSFQNNKVGGIGPLPLVFLNSDRSAVYDRMNQRVLKMLEMGWVEEVKCALEIFSDPALPGYKSIGYPQIIDHILHDVEVPIEEVQQETRRYGKRQLTFFRNQFEYLELDPLKDYPMALNKAENFFLKK